MRIFPGLLLLVLIAACAPVDLWYKQGARVSRLDNDLTDCRLHAAQSVPVNQQLARTPAFYTPRTTNCYSTGNTVQCYTSGGQVIGGNVYSYDANSGLRDDVTTQCMSNLGYRLIQLPQCAPATAKLANAPYTTLPAITEESCAAKVQTGRWVIVTP